MTELDDYSDALSELLDSEGEIAVTPTCEEPTLPCPSPEELAQIRHDILNLLNLLSTLDRETTRLRRKLSGLGGEVSDHLLNQLSCRVNQKAIISEVLDLHAKVDGFETFLRDKVDEEVEGETLLETCVRELVEESCEGEITRLENHVKSFIRHISTMQCNHCI